MIKPLKSENWQLFLLRIGMGWLYFQGGIVKILDSKWSAASYLTHTPEGNPFNAIWTALAGNSLIDFSVAWGLTLVGIALLLGKFLRESALVGAFLMVVFWASSFHGGLLQGFPMEHGWVVDDHLIYILVMLFLAKVAPKSK